MRLIVPPSVRLISPRAQSTQSSEFDSIINILIAIMDISLEEYVYTTQLFHYLPVVVSIPAAWFYDKYGSRSAIFLSLLLAAPRNCARALMFAPNVANWKVLAYYYWLLQYALVYLIMPIYWCLPLKVSEEWFLASERSFAWSMICVAPAVGNALAAFTIPRCVDTRDLARTLEPLAQVYLWIYLATLAVVCLCVRRSRPREGAPNERNQNSLVVRAAAPDGALSNRPQLTRTANRNKSIKRQMKRIFFNKYLMIQMVCLLILNTIPWSMGFVLQDILASAHFSQVLSGNFMAVSQLFACLIQLVGSLFMKPAASLRLHQPGNKPQEANGGRVAQVDVYKTRECKMYMILQTLAFALYCATLILQQIDHLLAGLVGAHASKWLLTNQWWLIIVTCLLYTFVRYWAASAFTEQGAQLISGNVSEATLSAVQTALSCVILSVCSVILISLRQTDSASDHGTHNGTKSSNYTRSILFANTLALATGSFYVLFFNPQRATGKERADDEENLHEEEEDEIDEASLAVA